MTTEKKDQAAVSQDALEKALTQLSDLAKSAKDEKNELLQKAMTEELSDAENARLMQLMKGGKGADAPADTLAKSATAGLQPASVPAVQAAVDVSEYLNAFHTGALGALETLSDSIEKSSNAQHEFNVTLAKAVVQTANLVKGLGEKLEKWGSAQVEAPKAARTQAQAAGKPLQKSFGGQAASDGEEQIQKGEILSLLEEMHVDSLKKGRGGQAACGEDLMKSIAKYEQTGRMTKSLVEEMKSYRASKRGAA